jgi:hypothetical protein
MIPALSMQPDEDDRSPPHPHKTRDFTQSRRRMKPKTNFVLRTRETKQVLDKIQELQQKNYIKDINQTYSPLNTPSLSRKPYIYPYENPFLLKAHNYSSKQSTDEGNKLIELELLGVSHSFVFFFRSFLLSVFPSPFSLSVSQSLGWGQTAAGQGITDDEEMGRVVCYGVKTLIWWKEKSSSMCVILSLAVSPRQQDDNACQFPENQQHRLSAITEMRVASSLLVSKTQRPDVRHEDREKRDRNSSSSIRRRRMNLQARLSFCVCRERNANEYATQ